MKSFLITILFITSLTIATLAQELNCKVTLSTEGIQTQNKELLATFDQTIADYMNKTRFTSERWEGRRIDCAMNILITSANESNNYTAQVVITSQRPIYKSLNNSLMLSINDGAWTFKYEKDQQLQQNQSVYDPITSYLDYYANLIIGLDFDSYEKLGGTRFFSKSLDLVNLGASSQFSNGWQNSSAAYSRRGLVEDLINEKFRAFREAYFDYHYNGIDVFQFKQEPALQNIVKLVNTLDNMRTKIDLRSVLLRVFFDAKNGELAQYLKALPNRDIFKTLKKIDPAHSSKYDEAMTSY